MTFPGAGKGFTLRNHQRRTLYLYPFQNWRRYPVHRASKKIKEINIRVYSLKQEFLVRMRKKNLFYRSRKIMPTEKEPQTKNSLSALKLQSSVYYVFWESLSLTWDHQKQQNWIKYILRKQPQAKLLHNQLHIFYLTQFSFFLIYLTRYSGGKKIQPLALVWCKMAFFKWAWHMINVLSCP